MNKKKLVITIVSLVAITSICIGGVMVYRSNTAEPVKVMDVSTMNVAGWYDLDNTQLTGQITSEFIQEVYPDTSRTIKKIYVKEGDKVKVGDKLLKYDVEEKELDLKLQELQIKGSNFEIEKMEKELEKLKKEKTVPDSTTQSEENDQTVEEEDDFDNDDIDSSDDISDDAMNLSLFGDSTVLSAMDSEEIAVLAEEGDEIIPGPDPTPTPDPTPPSDPTPIPDPEPAPEPEPIPPTEEPTEDPTEEPSTEETSEASTEEPIPDKQKVKVRVFCLSGATSYRPGNTYTFSFNTTEGTLTEGQFRWIVSDGIKITNDTSRTCTVTIPKNYTGSFTISLEVETEDISLEVENGGFTMTSNSSYDPNYDNGGGGYNDNPVQEYKTVSELKEAIRDKELEIAKKKQELSQAKISYKEAKLEIDEATVKSKIKGKVTTAYTIKSAPADGSPIIVIKAEDGIYVQTSVSELDLKTVKVGGKMTCTSWNSGEKYIAEIISISDYPLGSQASSGNANPNSSYYKVVGFIKDSEGLSTNDQVEVSYSSQSMGTVSEDAIYLPKAYIRSENNRSYVYKKGKNNKLTKQYVKIGSYMEGGNYMEITSGLTLEDQIAFPYGKNVVEGAKTVFDDSGDIIY